MSQALRPLQPFADADAFIGARLRAHRIARGLSQAALGAQVLISSSAMHMIETGQRSLPKDHAARLDEQLSTRGELAALAELRQRGLLWTREGNMDASRRTFLHGLAGLPAIAAADRIGRGMESVLSGGLPVAGIDHWHDTVAGYADRYLVTGPDQLLADMVPDLAAIHDLTAAHPYQRDLASVAARMAGLTSALLTDLGKPGQARHWLTVLDGYAGQAGDSRSRAWGYAARAVLEVYYATPERVLAITSRAIPVAQTSASAGIVMLHGLRSRALAALGNRTAAAEALNSAVRLHRQLSTAEASDYMWGFPERQLRWYESRTCTLTGDIAQASQARTEALRLYPDEDQVDRILLHLDEAACALTTGEPDKAASVAIAALSSVPRERRTTVVSRRAAELARALTPHQELSAVRALDEVRISWNA